MSTSVVLIPGAPSLVPELSGAAFADSAAQVDTVCAMLREAARTARRVLVVGTDEQRRTLPDVRSTLTRWGADIPVGSEGAPAASHGSVPDTALIGWWMLDRAGIELPRTFTGVDERCLGHDCRPAGDDAGNAPVEGVGVAAGDLVVVVADGPASLTPRAPIPEDPRGIALDAELAAWLRGGGDLPDPGPDTADAVGWWSRAAWLTLGGLVRGRAAQEAVSWSPFGVGYHGARWESVPLGGPAGSGDGASHGYSHEGPA